MKYDISKIKINILKKLILIVGFGLLFIHFVQTTSAATFEIEPTIDTIDSCSFSLDVYIDATAESVNAADIEIDYHSTLLAVEDQAANAGFQVFEGDAFQSYWGNISYVSEGKTFLTGGAFPDNLISLSSRELFARLDFKYHGDGEDILPIIIRFDGIGETLDSNIADFSTGNDLLTSVQNGLYTFTKDCRQSGHNENLSFCAICPDCYECTGINLTPTIGDPLVVTPGVTPVVSDTPTPIATPRPSPTKSTNIGSTIRNLIPINIGDNQDTKFISDDVVDGFDPGYIVKTIVEDDVIFRTMFMTCGLCLLLLGILIFVVARKKRKEDFHRKEFEENLFKEASKVESQHKDIIVNQDKDDGTS